MPRTMTEGTEIYTIMFAVLTLISSSFFFYYWYYVDPPKPGPIFWELAAVNAAWVIFGVVGLIILLRARAFRTSRLSRSRK